MALSYEFSIGSVRVKEKSLLTHSDLEQLLACKNESELCRILNDKGFGNGKTVDEIIDSRGEKMWKYLKSVAPDFEIFSPFIIRNDAHNLKVVLKGTMAGRNYKNLLITPCTATADALKTAVENRKTALLPDWLCEAADRAYETLAHTGDARLSDAYIDSAVTKEALSRSERFGSPFLREYFRTECFFNNVKIVIRGSLTGADKDYFDAALCDVAGFDKAKLSAQAIKGTNHLLDALGKISDYECAAATKEYKKSPSAFERYVDNKLILMARKCCKTTCEGAEPLIGYYLGCEAEKKVIHIISSGIRTGADTETIRERMREIYG